MIVEGKDVHATVREDVDVCIIGSGAGGALAALELSRRGLSVVVLEEGGAYFRKDFTGGVKDAMNRMYRNQGADLTTGWPAVMVPSGSCLGGTTVVNMGTSFRAPDPVLQAWSDQGLEDYGPEEMSSYYDRVEDLMSIREVKPEVMGRGGEIIAEGAEKLGLHPKPLRRNVSDACRGCGNCSYGCTEDAKQSMAVNVIPEAESNGAKFYCDTRATMLVHDKEKVCGVHGKVLDRETREFRHNVDISARVVVLSAGAFHTPAFLLYNDMCNRSGQVGKNLKLHLCGRATGIFDEVIDSHKGVCQNLYIDDYYDQGIMLEATFTSPASQLLGIIGNGQHFWDLVRQYRYMASLGLMISEKGSGKVKADSKGQPEIYFSVEQEDAETLHQAMIIADRILFMAGAKKVINANFAAPEVNSITELDKLAREKTRPADFMIMAFHPQGTCRMGTNPKKSVVAPTGECHDLANLYIADASIFPTSLGVNPQETIWAMTLKVTEALARNVFQK
ncbi:MAG: GMC family oxidoreductase [bacterium]